MTAGEGCARVKIMGDSIIMDAFATAGVSGMHNDRLSSGVAGMCGGERGGGCCCEQDAADASTLISSSCC